MKIMNVMSLILILRILGMYLYVLKCLRHQILQLQLTLGNNGRRATLFSTCPDINENTSITIDPTMKDDKLRNSLLTMSREKYRMTKKVEILTDEVETLKTSLVDSQLKCRHLQIDLAEVRGTDDAAPFALSFTGVSVSQIGRAHV